MRDPSKYVPRYTHTLAEWYVGVHEDTHRKTFLDLFLICHEFLFFTIVAIVTWIFCLNAA